MSVEEIHFNILDRFPFVGLEFQYLSAVEDNLVIPNVGCWDFKTLKHICRNGALYIRSIKDLDIMGINGRNFSLDSETSEDDTLPPVILKKSRTEESTVVNDNEEPWCSKSFTINCSIWYSK